MTQYPEVVLARELEMCYVNVALVTDYDAGLEGDPTVAAVTVADVTSVMSSNNERVRRLILTMIELMPAARSCSCGETMSTAFVS
jgi:5'-methylthioadenosine phosphorylase